jgi:hypothetical protein
MLKLILQELGLDDLAHVLVVILNLPLQGSIGERVLDVDAAVSVRPPVVLIQSRLLGCLRSRLIVLHFGVLLLTYSRGFHAFLHRRNVAIVMIWILVHPGLPLAVTRLFLLGAFGNLRCDLVGSLELLADLGLPLPDSTDVTVWAQLLSWIRGTKVRRSVNLLLYFNFLILRRHFKFTFKLL